MKGIHYGQCFFTDNKEHFGFGTDLFEEARELGSGLLLVPVVFVIIV